MMFKTRNIGSFGGYPAKIIELIIEDGNTVMTIAITNSDGSVDVQFIDSLKDLVYELEEQNRKLMEEV